MLSFSFLFDNLIDSVLPHDEVFEDILFFKMLFLFETGSIVTGVFTNSKTKAPSVIWSKKVVKSASKNAEEPIAIVINSGNANAFTGKEGTQAIEKVVSEISENLKISKKRILMASTGVIGEPLPYKKITDKIINAKEHPEVNGLEMNPTRITY